MIPDLGSINTQSPVVPNVGIGIGNIDINTSDIRNANIRDTRVWIRDIPSSVPTDVPVTVFVGTPIVNMPGCVVTHKENSAQRSQNKSLVDNDPKGNIVLCDGQAPSYNSMDYDGNQLKWETFTPDPPEAGGIKTKPPEEVEPPKPDTPQTPKTDRPDCPTADILSQNPVGTVVESKDADGGKREIIGYEWKGNPVKCVTLYRDVGLVEQVQMAIPSAGAITTTAGIAVVATTSALLAKPLADLLLKVVKPVTKKIVKKIASIRGKVLKVESRGERVLAQRDRNRAIMELRKALKK